MKLDAGTVPTLETERLVLRKLSVDDAPMRLLLRGERAALRYMLTHPETLEECRVKLAWIVNDMDAGNSKGWAIVKKDGGEPIGQAAIVRVDAANHRASLAYELVRAGQGKGFAREAMTRIVRYGFEEMGLHRLQVEVHPDNQASRALAEALGFVYEGTLRGNSYFDGAYYDDVIYARLNA